ncbi:hypothetical protein HUU05_24340 [candidate division KSB1 bacterium]|nr:hypothetical protein [candidate division KSB1 bacterium]
MKRMMGIVALLLVSMAWAGAVVSEFRGEPGRNKVTLKWTSEAEINLKGFEVQRGLNKTELEKLDFVEAKGATIGKTEYTYEDNSVFKSDGRVYFYRLKLVDKDGGTTETAMIEVNPTISSARATWGSIKAMFR